MRSGVKGLKLAVPLLGALIALAACVRTAYPPPPPLQVEVMPKPPVTTTPLIWRPGYWEWTGAAYAWVPGAYFPVKATVIFGYPDTGPGAGQPGFGSGRIGSSRRVPRACGAKEAVLLLPPVCGGPDRLVPRLAAA